MEKCLYIRPHRVPFLPLGPLKNLTSASIRSAGIYSKRGCQYKRASSPPLGQPSRRIAFHFEKPGCHYN